ncbi:MAG: FAD:protein FMN transferase [Desulfomonilia bacterium]
MKKSILIITVLGLIIGAYLWTIKTPRTHTMQFFAMDTIVEIQAQGSRKSVESAIRMAAEELGRIEQKFGYQDSLVTELNASHFIEDPELFDVMELALKVHHASGGAFSLTLRPILDAWGFTGTHPYRVPTDDEFAHWKALPGEEGIVMSDDGQTVAVLPGLTIDLGGIVKGYAADRASTILQEQGIHSGLVNAGGDIATFGGRTWKIGIRNPRGQGILAVIPVTDRAIATSGDYERYFEVGGKRYSHILDPHTGLPADMYMSTTVIAQTCIEADAWATALFVRGIEPFMDLFDARNIQWIAITHDGRVYSSPELRSYLPERIPKAL